MELVDQLYAMKRVYKRTLIISAIIIAFIISALYSGILAAGSYPYSETYKFNVSSDSLIASLKTFKKTWPSYNAPIAGLIDGKDNDIPNFYDAWVYFRKQNQIGHFIILSDDSVAATSMIWLHAINQGLVLGNWKTVNDDIRRTENLKIKKQFEDEVLKKLKLSYKDDGNNMFVFWK